MSVPFHVWYGLMIALRAGASRQWIRGPLPWSAIRREGEAAPGPQVCRRWAVTASGLATRNDVAHDG